MGEHPVFPGGLGGRWGAIIPGLMRIHALLFALVLLVPMAGLHGSTWVAEPAKTTAPPAPPELPGATVTDDAQRVAAAVLWDAMNAQPQNLRRSADLLRVMEEDVAKLRQLSRQQETEMAEFPDQVAVALALPWEELAYAALALMLALAAAARFSAGVPRAARRHRAVVVQRTSELSIPAPVRPPVAAQPAQVPGPAPSGPRWASQDEAVRDEIRKAQERVARVRAEREAVALRLKRELEHTAAAVAAVAPSPAAPPPLAVPAPVVVEPSVAVPPPRAVVSRVVVPPPLVPQPPVVVAPAHAVAPPAVTLPPVAVVPPVATAAPVVGASAAALAPVPPAPPAKRRSVGESFPARADVPSQPLEPSGKVLALQGACQQAEAFMQRGDSKSAIRVLSDHILGRTEAAPMAYLLLLDIYRRLDLREEYESLSVVFLCVFDHAAPEMAVTGFRARLARDDSLLAHAWLLRRLIAAWPQALQTLVLIEDLLFRHPGIDHTLLSMDAYRELLWLHELRLTAACLD